MKRPRVLLADDHKLVLEGLQKLLAPQYHVVATAEDGRTLMALAKRLEPDIVLMDIGMPLLNGIDATRQMKKALPAVKVLFVTMYGDLAYVTEAFRAGASGYLLKRSAGSELLVAIQAVLKGRSYVSPLLTDGMVDASTERSTDGADRTAYGNLSARQREVAQLVAEGHAMKEIACIMHVSTKTVEFHKARCMRQLGIRKTAELIRYAIAHGLVVP